MAVKRILLIEDDLATIDIYETVLEKAGFEVETIKWGQDALKKIDSINLKKEDAPDLVLLDIILPDLNGIEILEAMRKGGKVKKIPVFIMTNYADVRVAERAKTLGVNKHILKTDCTPRLLLELIKELT